MDGWMHGCMAGWMDGQIDEEMCGKTETGTQFQLKGWVLGLV